MIAESSCARTLLSLSCLAGLVASTLTCPTTAQSAATFSKLSTGNTQNTRRFADPRAITFAAIHRAAVENSLDITQVRRVLQTDVIPHRWIDVTESLQVDPSPVGTAPRFELSFVNVTGSNLTAAQKAMRATIYAQHAGYLFEHGAFHVTDPKSAAQNYTLHYLASGYRIQRPIHTFMVMPKTMDRSIWLVEFDIETGYPLACAEFDSSGQRVGGLEVTHFTNVTSRSKIPNWWQAKNLLGDFKSTADALRLLPAAPFIFPLPSKLPKGYVFQKARVTRAGVGPEKSLVMLYSDGIDDFFVAQTLNGFAPNLPTIPIGTTTTPYAIFSYENENVAQFSFYRKGVNYLVLGHQAQTELGDLTADLLLRAIGKN